MDADDNVAMNSPASLPSDGALALTDLALIQASGSDAASFLQGQLTNDVLKVGSNQARLAAYCSPQGRMLATFLVAWRPDPVVADGADATAGGSLWMTVSRGLQASMLKRLKMFVLRAKVTLVDADTQACIVGLTGASAAAWLGLPAAELSPWQQTLRGSAAVIRLPDALGVARWLWVGPPAEAQQCLSALPALSAQSWAWLQVHSGVVDIVSETSAQFVPQMLNFEVVGGVDFRKGCYPGQEIVARSQYLGKLKRRAFRLDGGMPAQDVRVGQEIFWSGDANQPAGMVAAFAVQPGDAPAPRVALLAELKVAVVDSGSLHLGSVTGPVLRLAELPYEIPPMEAVARLA